MRFLRSGKEVFWASTLVACPWWNNLQGSSSGAAATDRPCAAVSGGHIYAVGLNDGAAAIGVSALIERIDGSQNGSAVLVDQIDSTKVPAGVAHGYFTEVAIPSRNLEPYAFNRDRSIALTLTPFVLQPKRVAK